MRNHNKYLAIHNWNIRLIFLPLVVVFLGFFALPMLLLFIRSLTEGKGILNYWEIFVTPRYYVSILQTVGLSVFVTIATVIISSIIGFFLSRNNFKFKSLLISLLTLPIAFPGVVIGLMVILLAGRLGILGQITEYLFGQKVVFAYSIEGLFMGYVYFSIPRILLPVMSGIEKLDINLEEAGRSLGASRFMIIKDIIVPSLKPSLISASAICFATSMGAFGTAFTLATNINVIPMIIYTEFTLNANITMAAVLSIWLGLISWLILYFSHSQAEVDTGMEPV